MPAPAPHNPDVRISTFSRVLAWVFLACFVFVAIVGGIEYFRSGRSFLGSEAVLAILSALVITPLFAYAAITGRSPRWMSSMESMYDRDAERRGLPPTTSGRRIVVAVAVIVFGATLVAFGRSIGIFEGETGWFAAAVFFVAWVIVLLILWRNSRRPPR